MLSSLKARMIAFVLVVIVVISTLLCGVAYWKMKDAMSDATYSQIEQAANAKVSFVSEWVSSRQAVVASTLGRFGAEVEDLKPILDQAADAGSLDDMYIGQPDKTMTQFSKATPVPAGVRGRSGVGRCRGVRGAARRRLLLASGRRMDG